MDSNFHSHCTFCDGRSHPEDFVKFAVARGFRAYGFSSHAPLPFETSWNMTKDDMPEYLAEIDRLKKKYERKIELYVGLEIDYLDETYHAAVPFFRVLKRQGKLKIFESFSLIFLKVRIASFLTNSVL